MFRSTPDPITPELQKCVLILHISRPIVDVGGQRSLEQASEGLWESVIMTLPASSVHLPLTPSVLALDKNNNT
jgi:hypothetical protein